MNNNVFGPRIKQCRQLRNLSRKEFCEQAEISRSYLSLIENDGRLPSPDAMRKLIHTLASGDKAIEFDLIFAYLGYDIQAWEDQYVKIPFVRSNEACLLEVSVRSLPPRLEE